MKKWTLSIVFLLMCHYIGAQNEIELRTDGIVVPRTNTSAVTNPVEGMLIYDTTLVAFQSYNGIMWSQVGAGCAFERIGTLIRQKEGYDTDDFVFGRDALPPSTSINDTLMFFDKSKGAFRGGEGVSTTWSSNNTGSFSFGFGSNVRASGNISTAIGHSTIASGFRSTAMGGSTTASGSTSTAMGFSTNATKFTSIAGGGYTTASGDFSTSLGFFTLTTSINAMAVGRYNNPLSNETIISSTSPLFIVGNGDGLTRRSNALVVRKNGSVTVQSDLIVGNDSLPPESTVTDSLFFYDKSKAAVRGGLVTTSFGANWAPDSIGVGSIALGVNTQATGETSVALGAATSAFGDEGATALGYFTIANSNRGTVIGQFNDPIVARGYSGPDKPLLIIGNGSSSTSRSNAFVARENGEVSFQNFTFPIADGTADQVMTTDGGGQLSWTSDDWGNDGNNIHFNTGKVGIGDNSPDAFLEIEKNSTSTSPHLLLTETNSSNFVRMRFENSGVAGFWTIATKKSATAADNVMFFNLDGDSNNDFLELRGDGNHKMDGTLTQTSDSRLKHNIRKIENKSGDLMKINGYTYNWKNPNRNQAKQIGLIAQEVQEYFPELVEENEKGILSVNYIGLVPVLLESIKEQEKKINQLSNEQNDQKTIIANLQIEMNELKSLVTNMMTTKKELKGTD